MMMKKWLAAFAAATMLSACTWVDVTPEGEKVRVLSSAEVTKCKKMGQTTVSVLAKAVGVARHTEKVQEELNTLARNSAVELKGDTVVPISPVANGQQTFAVYRCMPQ